MEDNNKLVYFENWVDEYIEIVQYAMSKQQL